MKSTKTPTPLFDERDFEEMRKLGITEDEIETLQNADAIKQTVDMLPAEKDLPKFMAKVKELFAGKNPGQEIMNFLHLAETNPEYFLQIFALFEVLDIHENVPADVKVEKISRTDIETEDKAILKESVQDFLSIYNSLSPEEKKIFIDNVKKGR